MCSLTIIIPGEPASKARPRFSRTVKGVRTYTPTKTLKYEELVRYHALAERQKKGIKPIAKQMRLQIKAYFSIPKSYSKKRKERCINGEERPTKKPDSDNIAKIVLDGLNPKMKVDHRLQKAVCVHEGLYQDDRQVIDLRVEKWYSDEPRVEITAMWDDK